MCLLKLLARENDLEEIVENKFPTSVEEEELRYLHLEDGLCPSGCHFTRERGT